MSVPYYANAPLPDTNARQSAMTIRQPSTALLTIDSEDRYTNYIDASNNPSSPYNFTIRKTESLMPGFITRVGISEIVFPWTIPNINVKTNQILFSYSLSGDPVVTKVLKLTQGFYTPSELATEISTLVDNLPGNPLPSFVFQYATGQFSDSFDSPVFEYLSGTPYDKVAFSPLPYNTPAYPYNSNSKQLFNLLGLSSRNTQLLLGDYSNYTLCQAIRYVDIVCNQLTNSQAQKDQTSQTIARDMLCRIYVDSAPGLQSTIKASEDIFCPPGCAPTTIYHNYTVPKQIQWIPNQNIPGYLQFQVYDDTGDLLDYSIQGASGKPGDLPSQISDWSMTMLVSEN